MFKNAVIALLLSALSFIAGVEYSANKNEVHTFVKNFTSRTSPAYLPEKVKSCDCCD